MEHLIVKFENGSPCCPENFLVQTLIKGLNIDSNASVIDAVLKPRIDGWEIGPITICEVPRGWYLLSKDTSLLLDVKTYHEVVLAFTFKRGIARSTDLEGLIGWMEVNLPKAAIKKVAKEGVVVSPPRKEIESFEPHERLDGKGVIQRRHSGNKVKIKPVGNVDWEPILRVGSLMPTKPPRKAAAPLQRLNVDELVQALKSHMSAGITEDDLYKVVKANPYTLVQAVLAYKGKRYIDANASVEVYKVVGGNRRKLVLKCKSWKVEMLSSTSNYSNLWAKVSHLSNDDDDMQNIANIVKLLLRITA